MKKSLLIISNIAIVVIFCMISSSSISLFAQNAALDNIHNRKSVRTYKTNSDGSAVPVSLDTLKTIIRAGMAAPTGMNKQPWEFFVITRDNKIAPDKDPMKILSEKMPYAKMLKNAGAAIVVLGNPEESKLWYLDCSAATQNILLAIESMGLGGVWTAGYPYPERIEEINKALNIPSPYVPLCLIPLGYPSGETKVKDKWKPERIHINKW